MLAGIAAGGWSHVPAGDCAEQAARHVGAAGTRDDAVQVPIRDQRAEVPQHLNMRVPDLRPDSKIPGALP